MNRKCEESASVGRDTIVQMLRIARRRLVRPPKARTSRRNVLEEGWTCYPQLRLRMSESVLQRSL